MKLRDKSKSLPAFVGLPFCGVMLILSSHGALSDSLPTSGQFDQVTTITAPRLQVRYVQNVHFKGSDIRVDRTDVSQFLPLTQIETATATYVYSPLSGTGEESPVAQKLPPLPERMAEDTRSKIASAMKSGDGTYEGYNCNIYKTSEQNGTIQIQMWVSTNPNFPFTVKTIANDTTLSKITTVEIENISLGVSQDDNLFKVPASIRMSTALPQGSSPAAPSAGSNGAAAAPTGQSK